MPQLRKLTRQTANHSISNADLQPCWGGRPGWPGRNRWVQGVFGLLLALLVGLQAVPAAGVSNYELAQAADFNQVETYPIAALPSGPNYRPIGAWMGRLILPSEQEYAATPGDWAWIELWHAPTPALVGQRVKLTWKPTAASQAYVDTVTSDITFNQQANNFLENGNLVPVRLNGRKAVGPLQSLAGARPKDDITVRLVEAELTTENGQPVVQTQLEPIQITGREYALVRLLGADSSVDAPLPEDCPGGSPCPTEYVRVQHFDAAAQEFSGPTETVRIPQQPRVKGDRFFSTIRDLEESPAGRAGWYLYGSRDRKGVFTVQALKPRSLFRLEPEKTVLGTTNGLNYIDRQNWQDEPQRKGTAQSVLVSPTRASPADALAQWQEGDQGLVIHLFGGIGGENKEFTPAGTVTGHFAYGLATVVTEPLANELQFDIQYQQVYAHNSGGIISGTNDWAAYTGDLQRGWLNLRPISDVVVKLDYFTQPLVFGDVKLNLFRELLIQTQVLAARYRTGDGTGVAAVTPATSCVQDSNQALYIAIQQIRQQAEQQAEVIAWIRENPDDPALDQLKQFAALGQALEDMLTPYGVIRPDWENNAESLAGIAEQGEFISNKGLFSGALSWQTMMPRWGHDEVSRVFLLNGAQLWFLRPNQVGGYDGTIVPIPPTTLFGGIPILGRVVQRFADAFAAAFTGQSVGLALLALALYALAALPYGFRTNFLQRHWDGGHPLGSILRLLRLLVLPALVEEVVFRVMLLPHPVEGVPGWRWLLWVAVSTALFVLYHWVLSRTLYRRPVLRDSRFLILVGWLGLVLAGVYGVSGSLWTITLVHWLVVVVWQFGLGGKRQLQSKEAPTNASTAATAG